MVCTLRYKSGCCNVLLTATFVLIPRAAMSGREEEELFKAEFAKEVVEMEKLWKEDPKFLHNIATNLKSDHEKKSFNQLVWELIDRNPHKRNELQNLVITNGMPSASHHHHEEL